MNQEVDRATKHSVFTRARKSVGAFGRRTREIGCRADGPFANTHDRGKRAVCHVKRSACSVLTVESHFKLSPGPSVLSSLTHCPSKQLRSWLKHSHLLVIHEPSKLTSGSEPLLTDYRYIISPVDYSMSTTRIFFRFVSATEHIFPLIPSKMILSSSPVSPR